MTDLATLESQILTDIAAAGDEAALEAVRVAALGKKGSISALLATLGKMSPDERKTQGAAINLAKDKVTQALTARRELLKSAAGVGATHGGQGHRECEEACRDRANAHCLQDSVPQTGRVKVSACSACAGGFVVSPFRLLRSA